MGFQGQYFNMLHIGILQRDNRLSTHISHSSCWISAKKVNKGKKHGSTSSCISTIRATGYLTLANSRDERIYKDQLDNVRLSWPNWWWKLKLGPNLCCQLVCPKIFKAVHTVASPPYSMHLGKKTLFQVIKKSKVFNMWYK